MNLNFFFRPVIKHLRGGKSFYEQPFRGHTAAFNRTQGAVRVFFIVSVLYAAYVGDWGWRNLQGSQFSEVLWPFVFLRPWLYSVMIPFTFAAWIIGGLLAAVFIDSRAARIFHALGVFCFVGLNNSDGHFGHNYFALMWISMILAFLPKTGPGQSDRETRHRYMLVFWAAQFVVCVFYFMTGAWKVRGVLECSIQGLECELSERILTNIGAQELVQFRKFAPTSWLLFEYPWIAFGSYICVIWLHLISLYVAFRPRLHVAYGALRIVFHLGTLALFGVDFSPMVAAVTCVFLLSPFPEREGTLWATIRRFPPWSAVLDRGKW